MPGPSNATPRSCHRAAPIQTERGHAAARARTQQGWAGWVSRHVARCVMTAGNYEGCRSECIEQRSVEAASAPATWPPTTQEEKDRARWHLQLMGMGLHSLVARRPQKTLPRRVRPPVRSPCVLHVNYRLAALGPAQPRPLAPSPVPPAARPPPPAPPRRAPPAPPWHAPPPPCSPLALASQPRVLPPPGAPPALPRVLPFRRLHLPVPTAPASRPLPAPHAPAIHIQAGPHGVVCK